MSNIEIEIQVKIENSAPLTAFLKNNAEFKYENHQTDEYFSPSHRNFVEARPVKEWLRLRNSNGKYSVAYKNFHFDADGKSYFRDEYEINVDDLDKIRKIFEALDFKSLVVVDKLRKVWHYKDYEIALDSVKNLGDFVEIEYIGDSTNIDAKKITSGMVKFLKDMGCGKITRNYVGYPFQLLFPKEIEYEEI